jgi:hypothetical protein
MEIDNVASPDCPGLAALEIEPRSIESVLDQWSDQAAQEQGRLRSATRNR